jgi:hypothetical protein
MSDERNNFPDEHRTADRPCGVELHKMAEQASEKDAAALPEAAAMW